MPRTQETRSIAVGSPLGDDVLLLKSFTATEQLGRPFRLELELLSEDGSVEPLRMLGANITVRSESQSGHTRYFNGIVARWHQTTPAGGMARYSATLVPWLWLLSRAATCTIFQEQTIPDIIKAVFRRHGFADFQEKLTASYPTLEYCVQYRETDLNFVTRLMEQAGIYYHFTHEDGKHTLVLCDSLNNHVVYPEYAEIMYHEPEPQIAGKEYITELFVEQKIQTGKFAHTDFDFIKPTTILETRLDSDKSYTGGDFEVFDYPGLYTTAGHGDQYAKVRLEEFQTDFETAHGQSDSQGIAVGCKFLLADYPNDPVNKEWMVTATTIHAEVDAYQGAGSAGAAVFTCSFSAIDATVQYRSPRLTPKPLISGPQTAIVVGKAGEEIWTDQYGRVRLSFHWDRASAADETTSCWVRVAQTWAGKKWGSIHVPRIGHEVIVEFLEGDPDRPIITGRLYNAVEMPPYTLPDMATVSGLKSNSSKGGGGFNEIRFEDKKGEEQIFIHGEKNEDIRIKNDAFEWIGNDRHLKVVNDRVEEVGNDLHVKVVRDQIEEVVRDHHLKITGKQAILVVGVHSETIEDDVVQVYKKNQSTQVTNDIYIKGDNIVIEGATNVTIKVGESYIAIQSDGIKIGTNGKIVLDAKQDIEIKSAANIKAEATAELGLKGTAGATLESPAKTDVKSAATTVNGDGTLTLKGGAVMIN